MAKTEGRTPSAPVFGRYPSPMLHPAPTTRLDPTLSRGTLAEVHPPTATQPASVVVTFPNSDYRVQLRPWKDDLAPFEGRVGQRVIGRIRAEARRLDVCGAGGRFVEPVFGRPRRVQGMVTVVQPDQNTVIVSAGAGISIHLHPTAPGQSSTQFAVDDFLTCGVADGASFELVE